MDQSIHIFSNRTSWRYVFIYIFYINSIFSEATRTNNHGNIHIKPLKPLLPIFHSKPSHGDHHDRHSATTASPSRKRKRQPRTAPLRRVLRVLDLRAVPRPGRAPRRRVRQPRSPRCRPPPPRRPGARPLRALLPHQVLCCLRQRAPHVLPVLDLHHREPLPLVRRLAPHRRAPPALLQIRHAARDPAPALPQRRQPRGRPRRPLRRAAPGRRPVAAPHHQERTGDRGGRRERTGVVGDGEDGGARRRRRDGRGGDGEGDEDQVGGDEAGAGDGGRPEAGDDEGGGVAAPAGTGRALPCRRRRAPPRCARVRPAQGQPRRSGGAAGVMRGPSCRVAVTPSGAWLRASCVRAVFVMLAV